MSKASRKGSPIPISETALLNGEEEEVNCPLCLEEMDGSDCRFKPCPCGYQICRFCWHRIREEGNERCPACRRIYTDEDIEFLPETQAPVRPSKTRMGRRVGGESVTSVSMPAPSLAANVSSSGSVPAGVVPSRRHLVDIRVIQKNLVYVIGISARIAHEHILKETEYFGQFGRIVKIVVNRRNTGAPLPPSATASSGGAATTTSGSAYVTYARAEEAARAIVYVDGSVFDGRVLRATYGTTKYCSFFLRGVVCPNAGCMYLHEEGDQAVSYTKEELSAGKLHLHSNLVDKAEEAAHRQFGTIMYHPPQKKETPPNPIATSPASSNRSSANQSPVSTGAPTSSFPVPLGQDSPAEPPQPLASPINLALYEEEALSFLSRLSRWNPAIDFDVQGEDQPPKGTIPQRTIPPGTFSNHHLPGFPRGPSQDRHGNDNYHFDPFAVEAAAMGVSLAQQRLGLSHPQYYQSSALPANSGGVGTPASAARSSGTTPMISKGGGALLGFDWSGTREGRDGQASIRMDSSRMFVSKDPPSSTPVQPPQQPHPMRPAPVGSPVGQVRQTVGDPLVSMLAFPGGPSQSYAAPAPLAPANLNEIFGFYGNQGSGTSVMDTAVAPSSAQPQASRKILDASLLERQFFQRDQRSLTGGVGEGDETNLAPQPAFEQPVKFNQIAAASVPPIVANVAGVSVAMATPAPNVTNVVPTAMVAATKSGTSPGTIKILKREGKTGPSREACVSAPPTKDAPTAVVQRRPAAILTKDKGTATPSSRSSPAVSLAPLVAPLSSPIIPKSNVFAALLEDVDEEEEQEQEQGPENESASEEEDAKQKREKHRPAEKRGMGHKESTTVEPTITPDRRMAALEITPDNDRSTASMRVSAKDEQSSAKPTTGATTSTPAAASSKKKKQKKSAEPAEPKTIVRPSMPHLVSQSDYVFVVPSWTNGYAVAKPPSLELMSEEERTAWRRWMEEDLKCTRLEEQRLRARVTKLYGESLQWLNSPASVSYS